MYHPFGCYVSCLYTKMEQHLLLLPLRDTCLASKTLQERTERVPFSQTNASKRCHLYTACFMTRKGGNIYILISLCCVELLNLIPHSFSALRFAFRFTCETELYTYAVFYVFFLEFVLARRGSIFWTNAKILNRQWIERQRWKQQ